MAEKFVDGGVDGTTGPTKSKRKLRREEATQLRLNEAKQLGVKTLEPTLKAQQIKNRSPADRWGRIATYSVQIATEGDDRFVWPSIRATRNCGADEQRALTCSGQAPTATKLQR